MTNPPEQDPLKPKDPIDGDEVRFSDPEEMVPWDLDPTLLLLPLGVFERPRPVGEEDDLDNPPHAAEEPEFHIPYVIAKRAEPAAEKAVQTGLVAQTDPGPQTVPLSAEQPQRPLFESWYPPEHDPGRVPNFGHLLVLALATGIGWLGSGFLTVSALHYHLFGISTVDKAEGDIHYTLIGMATLYLISLVVCQLIFPLLWHKGFFAGVQWNASTALRLRKRMFLAACACFVLAMVDGLLLPGPSNAPIDKLFQSRQAAWLLFAFGVTFAPFFEEILFRGFLLPALSTACDWTAEQFTGSQPRPLDAHGQPRWSVTAMVISSIAVSIPFAYMHADQTGHAIGPFLLLVCVSLVLCWARLSTRSLAASVTVHASYNFLLFSLMMFGTGGFQHLDKM